jgi:hypothetical protein
MTPEDLVEIEHIKRLKYKYLRCLDQKLWDEIGGCFIETASAAYSGGEYSFEGREAIVSFLRESMGSESFLSSHRCHHPEIDLDSATEAHGIWALEDVVIEETFDITIRGAAFYEDRYVKVGDSWMIEHTGYLRSYEEIHPRASVEGLSITASWWGTGGRSSLGA